MVRKFSNRGKSTLTGAISAEAVTLVIQVVDGAKFPSCTAPDFFLLVLQNATDFEIIKVTEHVVGSPNMSGITRNFEGTTGPALGWADATNIGLRVTAGTLDAVINHIEGVAGAHTASAISNTPAGNIEATTVQAALNELDAEKVGLASPTFTGIPAAPTAAAPVPSIQAAAQWSGTLRDSRSAAYFPERAPARP